ncbi:MAG: UMP kinase [Spirochaetales bacterium]|nr:UMP kinase [Spirochaetales bacterium]
MSNLTVISLGGSIISPDSVDQEFIKLFRKIVMEYLAEDTSRKLIIVTGGGAPARIYQNACREIIANPKSDDLDWIGVAATHLNGQLIKAVFYDACFDPLVTDPTADITFTGKILTAAGWKPGFSSDNDAVILAERFGAGRIVNLSNIKKVYTADPKKDPSAKPLDHIGWNAFRSMVGDIWVPGTNVPFDPIAAKRASEIGLQVITAEGRNLGNFRKILIEGSFEGTTIGPEL